MISTITSAVAAAASPQQPKQFEPSKSDLEHMKVLPWDAERAAAAPSRRWAAPESLISAFYLTPYSGYRFSFSVDVWLEQNGFVSVKITSYCTG